MFSSREWIFNLGFCVFIGRNASGKTILSKEIENYLIANNKKVYRFSKNYVSIFKFKTYYYISIEHHKKHDVESLEDWKENNYDTNQIRNNIHEAFLWYIGSQAFKKWKLDKIDKKLLINEFHEITSKGVFKKPSIINYFEYIKTSNSKRYLAYFSNLDDDFIYDQINIFLKNEKIDLKEIKIEKAINKNETLKYGDILEKIIMWNYRKEFKDLFNRGFNFFDKINKGNLYEKIDDNKLEILNNAVKKYSWFGGVFEFTPSKKLIKYVVNEKNQTLKWFDSLSESEKATLSSIFFKIICNDSETIIWDDPFDSYDNQNKNKIMIDIISSKAKNKILLTHKIDIINFIKFYKKPDKIFIILNKKIKLLDLKLFNSKTLFKEINHSEFNKFPMGCSLMMRNLFELDDKKREVIIINSYIYKEEEANKEHCLRYWKEITSNKETSEILKIIIDLYNKLAIFKKKIKVILKKNEIEKKTLEFLINFDDSNFPSNEKDIFQKFINNKYIIDDISHSNEWTSSIIEILLNMDVIKSL